MNILHYSASIPQSISKDPGPAVERVSLIEAHLATAVNGKAWLDLRIDIGVERTVFKVMYSVASAKYLVQSETYFLLVFKECPMQQE